MLESPSPELKYSSFIVKIQHGNCFINSKMTHPYTINIFIFRNRLNKPHSRYHTPYTYLVGMQWMLITATSVNLVLWWKECPILFFDKPQIMSSAELLSISLTPLIVAWHELRTAVVLLSWQLFRIFNNIC